jgi:hypothetical protein
MGRSGSQGRERAQHFAQAAALGVLVKLSDIANLLSDAAEPAAFRQANANDFEERRPLLDKRGSVMPVRVNEDADIEVSGREVARLCNHFIAGHLDAVELAYVADALQLSERVTFADEDTAEFISEFTDPEVNGPFTLERAKVLVRELAQHT